MSEEKDADSQEQHNPYFHSDAENSDSENCSTYANTHSDLKCIGSVHDYTAQETLSKASRILRESGTVCMKIAPEPTMHTVKIFNSCS